MNEDIILDSNRILSITSTLSSKLPFPLIYDRFVDIPYSLKDKEHNKYKRYLLNLVEYLRDFYSRSSPLADISTLEAQKKADFEFKWKEGTIRGWDEINKSDKSIYC